MKRIGLLLSTLILPAMLFATGTGAAGGENHLDIAWWGNTARDERTNQVIALFVQQNAGVTVEPSIANWGGYFELMNTRAAANTLPDVMQHDISQIGNGSERNLLVDLQPFAQRNIIDLRNWEGGLGAGTINGRLEGLLLGSNALSLIVDMDVLQQAGVTIDDTTWTWADYEAIARQVHQRTGRQTMPMSNFRQALEHISRQFGVGVVTNDHRQLGVSTNPQALAALRSWMEMQLRLSQAGVHWDVEDAFMTTRSLEEFPFNRGMTWDDIIWSNQFANYQRLRPNSNLRILMFPTVAGPRAPFGLYTRPSMFISMTRSARNQDLSARFINFFVNDIEANRILLAERGVPVPSHIRADLLSRVDANLRVAFEFADRIAPFSSPADPPPPVALRETELNLQALLMQVLTQRITLANGIDRMVSESNAILQR